MKKRILQRISLGVATCFLCVSCGFTPMYGSMSAQNGTTIQGQLEQIEISNIPDREGQFLRNALIDRFYKNGRPADPNYILEVSKIGEESYDLDITVSSDTTRTQLTLSTVMSLVNVKTRETVLKRNLKASASYNVMESEFATRVSEQNTRENALSDLGRQIERQIALYFNRGE